MRSALDNPFLKAGSFVSKGQAKVVVVAVGAKSTRGIIAKPLDTESDTTLQTKLKNLTSHFTFFALVAGAIIFVELIISLFLRMGLEDSAAKVFFGELPKTINLIVVLIIVAIPEGLPLTVGISLAFSVMRMYNFDKILVKKLDAPEKMGEIEEIIIGKTGTITQADMKVTKFWCEDNTIINSRNNTILNCELA